MHLHKEMLHCKIANLEDKSICKTLPLLMRPMHTASLVCQNLSIEAESAGEIDRFIQRESKFYRS